MEILGRDSAPFSGRVWQQIDGIIAGIKASNCTARRFLDVDGPWGLGLTSISDEEDWLDPDDAGPDPANWNVPRAVRRRGGEVDELDRRGTFLVQSDARPIPLISSEFLVGIRGVEAFDDECQPLELYRVTRSARDVALEEERLLYYGAVGNDGLLQTPAAQRTPLPGNTPVDLLTAIQNALQALAGRGFAGPFALALAPILYTRLIDFAGPAGNVVLFDTVARLFSRGIHMAPVILPPGANNAAGVIVTCVPAYVRLVIAQDWVAAYRGMRSVFHRFLILNSLRLVISEPAALQTLHLP